MESSRAVGWRQGGGREAGGGRVRLRLGRALLASALLGGCAAGDVTTGEDPDAAVAPGPTIVVEAGQPATSIGEATCEAMPDGSEVVANSPEGDLWLLREGRFLVRSADGSERSYPVEAQPVDAYAVDDETLFFVTADGKIFRQYKNQRFSLDLPVMPGAGERPRWLCGATEVAEEGVLLSARARYVRSDRSWLRLEPVPTAEAGFQEVAKRLGSCMDERGVTWLHDGQRIYRLHETAPLLLEGMGAVRSLALLGQRGWLAWAEAGLFVGAAEPRASDGVLPWWRIRFEDGSPLALWEDGQDGVWVRLPEALYRVRWTGTDAEEPTVEAVELPGVGAIERVLPDQAGAWILEAGRLCRWRARAGVPRLVVRGLRPYERRSKGTPIELSLGWVEAGADAPRVVVEHDGMEVHRGAVPPEPLSIAAGGVGSHVLRVGLAWDSAGGWLREYRYVVVLGAESTVDWDEDVRPIYEAHCQACHDASSSSNGDLSTEQQWSTKKEKIRQRVVEMDLMPPPGSAQRSGWGQSQRRVIQRWLEQQGM